MRTEQRSKRSSDPRGFLVRDRFSSLCNFLGVSLVSYIFPGSRGGAGARELPPSPFLGASALGRGGRRDYNKIVRRHSLHRLNVSMVKQKNKKWTDMTDWWIN